LRRNNDFERIFRQFKRDVEREGIIREVKAKEFYEKPSQIRRRRKLRKVRRSVSVR
jgi:small subunit ribosomal protein S21